jgi:phosphoglycolate phosphatase
VSRRLDGFGGVLFDLDGVLVFSREAWRLVYNETLEQFGHPPIPRVDFDAIFGNGTQADRDTYMPERTVEEIDEAYRRLFERHLDAVEVNPRAAGVLTRLRGRGLSLAVATNTSRALARRLLRRFDLLEAFDATASPDEAGAAKPDPAVVRLAAGRIGVPLSRCLLVGDSRYDEEAARAAPAEFLGFRYGSGFNRIEELSEIFD